jgi:Domain of unknown function (DUF4595) with porin-like fold
MKRVALSFLALGIALFLSLSCGKKSSPAPNCQLITITDVAGSTNVTANIAYNNDGKISTIQETGTNPASKVFTYIGNLVMVATTASSGNVTDSVVLNSSGLMTYWLSRDASSNTSAYTFTYASNGQLLKSTQQSNAGPITTTTYTFTNGDMTGSSDGTNTAIYTYYTDKAFADGDYLKTVQIFNYGALYVKNAHLIKGFQQGSTVENFNYTFDTNGKVTGVTATNGANIENVTDQYNCN